jgi:NAD(P)-dependent dehydrogenase (short-subunit alcohol dehydrogenase family)
MSAYVTSKTAIVKFTELLAAELHEFKVRAFSIHPGTVKTAMAQTLLRPENARWLPWFKEIFDEGKDNPPKIGSRLVQYLSTGRADHLSGRYFLVPIAGEATVDAFKRTKPEEAEDANLLRIRILEKDHPEAGV